jgi:hypothetical protein
LIFYEGINPYSELPVMSAKEEVKKVYENLSRFQNINTEDLFDVSSELRLFKSEEEI